MEPVGWGGLERARKKAQKENDAFGRREKSKHRMKLCERILHRVSASLLSSLATSNRIFMATQIAVGCNRRHTHTNKGDRRMDKLSVQLHAHKRARASLVRMSLRFFLYFCCVLGGVTQRTKGVILPSVSLNELWTVLCTGA